MKMRVSAVALACLAGACPLMAQEQVVPLGYDVSPGPTSFLSPLASVPRTYQILLHEDQLVNLVGSDLTGIALRNSATITTSWPATNVLYPSYDIFVGPSVAPANRILDFAANATGPVTQVRSGELVIPAESYTIGSSPNAFGPTIEFNQPYPYGGGHLLIEIRHTGSNGTSRSTDALGTASVGYLEQFAALWQGTAGVSQGNFAITRISYDAGSGGCYANCDGSTVEPILNVDDFTCFINEYAQAQTLPPSQQIEAYANCDGSTVEPVLNVDDFTCFINEYAVGCP